jgi:hypothetical protein
MLTRTFLHSHGLLARAALLTAEDKAFAELQQINDCDGL